LIKFKIVKKIIKNKAILHVGCVTKYLSDAIVNGFVVGAAYHVVISQIPSLLGIKLGEEHMPFVIIGELIQIAKHIGETKPATVVISIIACIFLYVIKVHVNEK
jgi:MFS superfamily sulfate permease-like transporter